jgi:hypothetical protein
VGGGESLEQGGHEAEEAQENSEDLGGRESAEDPQETDAPETDDQQTDAHETDAQGTNAQETDAQGTDEQETDEQETDAQPDSSELAVDGDGGD